MVKHNYRFANYATHSELFELQVEPGTTVGALKELAEKHLSGDDNLCPMQYFGKWYCECRVGARTRMMCIEERDNELPLAEAGLEDESIVYLEGPMFSEEQADVGRAIAAVRAESTVANAQLASQHATQVQALMDELRSLKELVMTSQQKQEATNTKLSEFIHNQRLQAELKDFSRTKQPDAIKEQPDAIKEQADAGKGAQLESGFKAKQQPEPNGGYNALTSTLTDNRQQSPMSYPRHSHRSNTPSLEARFRTTTSSRAPAQQTALRGSSMGPSTVPQRSLPSTTYYTSANTQTPRAPSTTNQLSAAKTTPVSHESQRHVSTYTTSASHTISSPQAPFASQQSAVSSTDHPEPPQGFRNMDNTCYQNASMQALLAVPHLIEGIEEHYGSASTALEASLSSSGHRISATRMSTSVAKDIVELAKRITTSSLCLSALKAKCTERNDVFTGSRQNDAHEFIRVLLLLLHENVNRIRGKPADQEMKDVPGEDPAEAARRWRNYHHTRDDSLVYDIFGGQQQSVVECRACGHESWSFEPFLDLVLDMPSSRISSPQISLLLQWYTGLSKLEGADRYYCAKCKKPQEADRQVTIAWWPAVLSLSLARFDRYGRKNSEEVTFDEVLLTAADCSADRKQRQYELFSVVIHTGTTDYGHYYAYVKKVGKWFRCDDSSVIEVNFSMVRSEGRGASILFYRKVRPTL